MTPPSGDALHEEPLPDEEEDDDRQHDERRGGHEQVVGDVVLAGEEREPDRERVLRLLVEVEQRQQELVPRRDRGEDRDHRDGGPGQGKDDPPEDLELVGAIDLRGIGQLAWDAHHELAHEEDVERVAQERRDDQRQERVDPGLGALEPERRQLAEDIEQGDEDDRIGQEDRGQADVEDLVATGPVDP